MPAAIDFQHVLGPDGPIARAHPGYEYRPAQIRMAEAVARAIDLRRHLCVEAGTGTGKTLAYLLPALASGRRVVISTGTKNLQEQLFFKDVPFLERALGRRLSVTYMKGRGNYLCLHRLAEIEAERHLFSRQDPEHLQRIRAWAATTETGDRAELKDLPEELPLWRHVDARRETCLGQKCADWDACFVTRVRQRALESDIVIVNHHLFFADLALRRGDFATVLPDYAVVIFDEAHELEDVATHYFGVMVSNYRVDDLVRDARRALDGSGGDSSFLADQLAKLTLRSGDFFGHFHGREGRFPLRALDGDEVRRGPSSEREIAGPYRRLAEQLGVTAAALASVAERSETLDALSRRASELRDELGAILASASFQHVYWYEVRGRGVFLWASPIQVASILAERLFAAVDAVVLTSATLATGGTFGFIRSRLGIEDADELVLGSHFDFERQAIFYVPREIPEPREEGWLRHACRELERILELSQGRAFVLFTSYAQMELVYHALEGRLPFPMLLQGERSKAGLLEAFRATPGAVLFATASFWQGVDVQGEQLSCVVVDKLPFSVPSDPVVAARIRHLTECGQNPFYDYQIPEAAILLKQGFGRLIRSAGDRGVLALLDRRIVTRGYGRVFRASLPPVPLTHDLEDVGNFFRRETSSSVDARRAHDRLGF